MKDHLENLIRNNKGAVEALKALANGASIRVVNAEESDILVSKESGKIIVSRFNNFSSAPDITIIIPGDVIQSIFSANTANAREFIVNSAEILTETANRERISVSAHIGMMKLSMLGYLKVFPLGGSPLIRILSKYGINSFSEIKKRLAKLTNR